MNRGKTYYENGKLKCEYVDFTLEDKGTVKEVIEAYQEVLSNDYKLGTKATKLYNKLDEKGTTAGHYYKGVE